MTTPIDAITLHEPFATFCAWGLKPYETRHWMPSAKLVGKRIAIHAGRNKSTLRKYLRDERIIDALRLLRDKTGVAYDPEKTMGRVLCTATLDSVWLSRGRQPHGKILITPERTSQGWAMAQNIDDDGVGDYSEGRYLWLLKDVIRLVPAPLVMGHQGFWKWERPDARWPMVDVTVSVGGA